MSKFLFKRRFSQKKVSTRGISTKEWNSKWVSASATHNYMLKDPLVDCLKSKYSISKTQKGGRMRLQSKRIALAGSSPLSSFTDLLFQRGNEFEDFVVDELYAKFGTESIVDVGANGNARSQSLYKKTINEIKKGTPIILAGILRNYKNKTFGVPDIIIRSDYLNKLTKHSHLLPEEEKRGCMFSDEWHYRIIDIKFSTLPLAADGLHLYNSGHYPGYKAQTFIYNEALASIQHYNPNTAYILGRKWGFARKGEKYFGSHHFDRLGVIDYVGYDRGVIEDTAGSIEWVKSIRKNPYDIEEFIEKNKITVRTKLPHENLYPNMSRQNSPYYKIKSAIADKIGEITSVWYCGVYNRNLAHDNNVFTWRDPKCTASLLGFNNNRKRIIDTILEVNRSDSVLYSPRKIISNEYVWRDTDNYVDIYLDFETINNIVFSSARSTRRTPETPFIFLSGVGLENNGKFEYTSFVTKTLTQHTESRTMNQLKSFIDEVGFVTGKKVRICHYGSLERGLWLQKFGDLCDYTWMDLYRFISNEPFVVKGSLNFSLKSIVRAMHSHKLIETTWDDDGVTDGMSAMLEAHNIYSQASRRKFNVEDHSTMQNIVKYNEVDVKVMWEILSFFRNKL